MSDHVKLRIHLSSGSVVEATCAIEDESEEDELIEALASAITEETRPHWHLIENLLVFTGAVSAIEVV